MRTRRVAGHPGNVQCGGDCAASDRGYVRRTSRSASKLRFGSEDSGAGDFPDLLRPGFATAAVRGGTFLDRRPGSELGLHFRFRAPACRRNASVLVGMLWCLALLAIVVIGVLHTARMDLTVGKNCGDRIQAHYLALAGVEKAKALIYQNAAERSRTARNHSGELYNAPEAFRDVALGRGQFSVFRQGREEEGGGVIYGVSDEESRLNLNVASNEELTKLPRMTPDVVAAIIDWRDADNEVSPGGAEIDYYASLQPPYQPRNGPFQTIREMLLVRGVSPELLLGPAAGQNKLLEPGEDGRVESEGLDADAGWADLLTVDSVVDNVSAAGEDRVNAQTADESALTAVRGLNAQIAKAIVAYRGQNRFQSIANLLDVTAAQNQGQSGSSTNSNQGGTASSGSASGGAGSKVISADLLGDIADSLTVQADRSLSGLVNINTAGQEVLECLPGLTHELAQAIIAQRQANGFFDNPALLLKVPGLTPDIFKQLAPRVTARSETYRILCEGKVNSTGTRQRVQEIVHVGLTSVTTVSYREDDL